MYIVFKYICLMDHLHSMIWNHSANQPLNPHGVYFKTEENFSLIWLNESIDKKKKSYL